MRKRLDNSVGVTTQTGDIKKDFSKDQLAAIGAVALVYNDVEELIDLLLIHTVGIPIPLSLEVTSRMNGIDGKIQIISDALKYLKASDQVRRLIGESLGGAGFGLYKKYRDGIIHARNMDVPTAMARTAPNRGKVDHVLLSTEALDGLYNRLILLRDELKCAGQIAIALFYISHLETIVRDVGQTSVNVKSFADAQEPGFRSQIDEAVSRYAAHQGERLALAALPNFPTREQAEEGLRKWTEGMAATSMGWFQPLSQPLATRSAPQQGFVTQVSPPSKDTL